MYPAHILLKPSGVQCVQTVEVHCRNCAAYAAAAAPLALRKTAYLAGLLHDMGKYTAAFQAYLTTAVEGGTVRRGSVNHTFAGVRFVMERWHTDAGQSFRNMTAELLAFVVGAHHGQFDCLAPDGTDGFLHRMESEKVDYAEAKENFLGNCAAMDELDGLFAEAVQEVASAQAQLQRVSSGYDVLFYIALLARQLLSAVIEGDRRDTAEFMHAVPTIAQQNVCWTKQLAAVEQRMQSLPLRSEMDAVRRVISDRCRAAAERGSGIYRLTVPTGGGKTLTALRYALAAAAAGGKQRIFFVIPLLSVLEQNAAVIREFLQNDAILLEHHSNLVREKTNVEELDQNELLMENWRAPVVITTLVQLLNTLFSGKTSCIRRMGALNDSVIVVDEVQSVPRNMLSEWNLALNFLTAFCGATVVLCSATQPCLEQTEHPIRYADSPELVEMEGAFRDVFRRTEIIDRRTQQGYSAAELAKFAVECAARETSLLLVCNTKSEARTLFSEIERLWDGALYHLSTAMCMQHRIQTLDEICTALESHKRLICVSTQLVEAGVDFSFGCVIRISAGLDNVVQAAGRCNRNGEFGKLCPVYIVNLRGENLAHLKEIRQNQQAAESLLIRFHRNPDAYRNDLTGDAAIRAYYRELFGEMAKGSQDYPIPKYDTTMLDLLSVNTAARAHSANGNAYLVGQAFQTAGAEFHVFDDNTEDVLVPFGAGIGLIEELCSERAAHDLAHRADLLRQAKRFTVSLYAYELERLRKASGLFVCCDGAIQVLRPGFYSDLFGFSVEGLTSPFMEV